MKFSWKSNFNLFFFQIDKVKRGAYYHRFEANRPYHPPNTPCQIPKFPPSPNHWIRLDQYYDNGWTLSITNINDLGRFLGSLMTNQTLIYERSSLPWKKWFKMIFFFKLQSIPNYYLFYIQPLWYTYFTLFVKQNIWNCSVWFLFLIFFF